MGINGKAPTVNKLILVGDSTVKNGVGDASNGQWGWGDHIARYFDPDLIEVVNRAHGGGVAARLSAKVNGPPCWK